MDKIKVKTFKCLRCGHIWIPRKPEKPLRCGKCKSPYWNRPKLKPDEILCAKDDIYE